LSNRVLFVDISGTGGNTFSGIESVTLPAGKYTVAKALKLLAQELDDLSGTTGASFTTVQIQEQWVLYCNDAIFSMDETLQGASRLAFQLDINRPAEAVPGTGNVDSFVTPFCPDLRPYRYIDFVSSQLTYAQDLKDNSTAPTSRDVLCRWYFADDQLPTLDEYGFPILMGYTLFTYRRIFNPPKQIKWDSNQPVGNLAFEVYGDTGSILPASDPNTNWLMTLQFSEN
jgi:hypothetical protein